VRLKLLVDRVNCDRKIFPGKVFEHIELILNLLCFLLKRLYVSDTLAALFQKLRNLQLPMLKKGGHRLKHSTLLAKKPVPAVKRAKNLPESLVNFLVPHFSDVSQLLAQGLNRVPQRPIALLGDFFAGPFCLQPDNRLHFFAVVVNKQLSLFQHVPLRFLKLSGE
jgi:hypothetical protein